jgi:uncharacterized protein with HEPN domain
MDRHPEVPWRRIAAFRHRVAHGYFELSLEIVWQIWNEQIGALREQIQAILHQEFPDRSFTRRFRTTLYLSRT